MIAMLDTSQDHEVAAAELGCDVEQLVTPLTRFRLRSNISRFAVDNGGFQFADVPGLASLLKREEANKKRCRFVAVPDVVCSARRTMELFDVLRHEKWLRGWPLALVAQNGLEDLTIPWAQISAVFIGGDNAWKTSPHAVAVMKAAKALGKWVHVGRVNTPDRWRWAEENGADSVDGTGIARYSHMRLNIADRDSHPVLPLNSAEVRQAWETVHSGPGHSPCDARTASIAYAEQNRGELPDRSRPAA